MTKVWFDVISKNGTVCTMGFTFRQACLFGWVGRNQEEVRAHAAELAAHGIRGPKNIPEYFLMTSDVITHSPEIVVVGDRPAARSRSSSFVRMDRSMSASAASTPTANSKATI